MYFLNTVSEETFGALAKIVLVAFNNSISIVSMAV